MNLSENKYLEVSTAQANIVDSFVAPSNKIGAGAGEARLYVSSQRSSLHSDSFFNFNPSLKIGKYVVAEGLCFFSKDNLIKYLEDAKVYYEMPIADYRENIVDYYEERINTVNDLDEMNFFTIYNQNGSLDSDRFYIGSKDTLWELMRTIALPKISTLYIHKLVNSNNEDDIKYSFELFITKKSNSRHLPSIIKAETETEKSILNDTNIDATEKETLIKARKGQGEFRKNTLKIMPDCPFTGVNEPSLLRSSHIMPWAHCLSNHQRLDGNNGLILTPTYDVLFDKGLISFENDGRLLISENLTQNNIQSFNLKSNEIYDIGNTSGLKNTYLDYHRKHIFN